MKNVFEGVVMAIT